MRHSGRLLLLAGLGLAAATGCGGEERPAAQARARPLAIEVTEPSPGRYRFRAPARVPAGMVRMTLRNAGMSEHRAQLVRVEGRHTAGEVLRARRGGGRIPGWLSFAGGVGVTRPGRTASVTQPLRPGTHYLVGATGDRGTPARLEVVGEAARSEPPRPGASIESTEYSFAGTGLRPGRNAVRFHNAGFEPHHVVAVPIRRGSTLADVRDVLEGRGSGRSPVDLDRAQETAILDEGQTQVTELDLRPGSYALLCFVRDRGGGPPHVARGMVDGITVR
ncbi:MAG: hypothetical protein M3N16_05025 [Actinomycetota bacterium]|nr:hypothetical protein [Actinomycetota bacterium]